jgi:integrating conjugative element protein (TIGR03761 family)
MAINQEQLRKQETSKPHEAPGPLRSAAVLTLQTKEAQKLIIGRPLDAIDSTQQLPTKPQYVIGLQDFGRRMNRLWMAAQQDDPYADWYLWQIETALFAAKADVSAKTKELALLLESVQAIKIKTSQSTDPIDIEVNFSNPYGYMATYLVAEFDALACLALTAWHIGLLDRSPCSHLLNITGGTIRNAFGLTRHWHFTGVTRTAMRNDDTLAKQAKSRMGKLPQEILDREHRAKMAPEIKRSSLSSTPNQTETLPNDLPETAADTRHDNFLTG